jgi:hypothetical protein
VDDAAPPKRVRPGVLLLGALAVAVVVLFGVFLALFDVIGGGASAATGEHLDQLEGVIAATTPASAARVSQFRNDACDSMVNEVGATLRTGRTLFGLQAGYRRRLEALGWKVTTTPLRRRDTSAPLEAAKRFDWGRAYFRVEPGPHRREIDVTAGFNCGTE